MTDANVRQLVDEILDRAQQLDSLVPQAEPSRIILRVKPGDDVNRAYAQLHSSGGTLLCAPGLYSGVNIVGLTRPPGSPLVVITTDNGVDLPAAGAQVTREHLPGLADFRSSTVYPTLYCQPRAHHLAFQCMAFGPTPFVDRTLVALGDDKAILTSPDDQAEDFAFDRVLWTGEPGRGQHVGLRLHARRVTLTGCGFYDFVEPGRDSQCIVAWNGGQDVVIENCTLEGGGENLLLGGADAACAGLMPQRWALRRVTLRKNPIWKAWPIEDVDTLKPRVYKPKG